MSTSLDAKSVNTIGLVWHRNRAALAARGIPKCVIDLPHPLGNVHDFHYVHRRLIGDPTLAMGFGLERLQRCAAAKRRSRVSR
jgi:hypothetical protein